MRALVLGAGGILGTALRAVLPESGIEASYRTRAELDVRDGAAVAAAIAAARADVLINASAYTKVDLAEDEREAAFAVNGVAPGVMARRCREAGARLVHVSTDFVFDGAKDGAYGETDEARPLSVYGASKLCGEREIARELGEDGDYLVVRTSWHYGAGGANFVRTIHDRAAAGAPLRVVSDQRGRPTYSAHLAAAIVRLLERGCRGLYHYADDGAMSWLDFARAIVDRAGLTAEVAAITSADLDRKARRPRNSVLATAKYAKAVGSAPPSYEIGLVRYLHEIAPLRPLAGAPAGAAPDPLTRR